MSFMDFSEWSCCKEIRTSERTSETLETSQYRQFRRPAVTRGVQPAWKKNNFQNGTRNWAFMELEIEDLRKCMLIISADEAGQILETTKKFDKVFGEQMTGHSFWKDVAGEATDPLAWQHLYNLVSIARRHVSKGLIVGEKCPKRLESLEFIPLEGSNYPITLIIFRFEIDDKGNEGKPVDGDLLKWSRSKNQFANLDIRRKYVERADKSGLEERRNMRVKNVVKCNSRLNTSKMTDLKKDENKTIKTFRHGTHDPKTDFTVPHSPRPNFNPHKSDSVVDPYGHLQMKGEVELMGGRHATRSEADLAFQLGLDKVKVSLRKHERLDQELQEWKSLTSPLGTEHNPETAKKLAMEKARERQIEREKMEAREERMKIVKHRLRDTFTYEPPALIAKRHEF